MKSGDLIELKWNFSGYEDFLSAIKSHGEFIFSQLTSLGGELKR